MSTWPNTPPTGSESWTDREIDNVLADLHPEDFAADVIRQLRGERDRARAIAISRHHELQAVAKHYDDGWTGPNSHELLLGTDAKAWVVNIYNQETSDWETAIVPYKDPE